MEKGEVIQRKWAASPLPIMNQQSTQIIASCAAAVAPVGSLIVNANPAITALAGILSVVWFAVLLYDRFLKRK